MEGWREGGGSYEGGREGGRETGIEGEKVGGIHHVYTRGKTVSYIMIP